MRGEQDYWTQEGFEDEIETALDCFRKARFRKNRGSPPADRMSDALYQKFAHSGVYIPGSDRGILGPDDMDSDGAWEFDVVNDTIPSGLTFGLLPRRPDREFVAIRVEATENLGQGWYRRKEGLVLRAWVLTFEHGVAYGERVYATMAKDGKITSCEHRIVLPGRPSIGKTIKCVSEDDVDPSRSVAASRCVSIAMQFLADSRFCFAIEAIEQSARVRIGCGKDEVASLLYARDIPRTDGGRKRPILHVVSAHRRRMQAGTELKDVAEHLRGVVEVEMDGTLFRVHPPQKMYPHASSFSKRTHFDPRFRLAAGGIE